MMYHFYTLRDSLTNSLVSLIPNRLYLDVAAVVPDGEVRVGCLELEYIGRINVSSKWLCIRVDGRCITISKLL